MAPVPVDQPLTMPLYSLMSWSPFRIDALGLVTLIGAEEVNQAVGRLVSGKYTGFLPLLGQYIICGNQFTAPASGFTLYNLTDAITTTSLAGWFTRWLRFQELKDATTEYQWEVLDADRRSEKNEVISVFIGTLVHCVMIVMTVLMGDWWGLANSLALAVSVFVRWYLVQGNIRGLNNKCIEACYNPSDPKLTEEGRAKKREFNQEIVKILVTLNNGKMVIIRAPRGLITTGFVKKPTPVHEKIYTWTRAVGWFFFGVHVIALGQCDLVTQILTVVFLVTSTWVVAQGFGCNEMAIGSSIRVTEIKNDLTDRRIWAYAKVEPTADEEASLLAWNLLPRPVNTTWWEDFEKAKMVVKKKNAPSPSEEEKRSAVVRDTSLLKPESEDSTLVSSDSRSVTPINGAG